MSRASCVAGTEDAAVTVAIIIPAYGQPWLLSEALYSALRQRADFRYAIVVVNDGCPIPDTRQVCLSIAAANPERIFFLEKRNAGLSAARNTGIDFALAAFPHLEAVYFLDCDNRVGPHLLQRLLNGLRKGDDRTGWAYTDIDKFGFSEFGDTSGPYSPLEHLFRNVSEAGSMASRRMLDAGLRFDTNMRQGLEDWEFWLQGLERGFCGVHVADAGFRYRRRGESMLVAAERDLDTIVSYIRKRHPALFNPRAVLTAEVAARSRYAVYHPDTGRVSCFTAVANREIVSHDDYLFRLLRSMERPGYGSCPGHLIVMNEELFDALEETDMLAGILWLLECGVRRAALVAATFRRHPGSGRALHWRSMQVPAGPDPTSFLMPPDNAHVIAMEATALLAGRTADMGACGLIAQPNKPLHGIFLEAEIGDDLAPELSSNLDSGLARLTRDLAAVAEREHRSLWQSVPLDRYRARPAMPRDVYLPLFALPSLFPCAAGGTTRRAALLVERPCAETLEAAAGMCDTLSDRGWLVDLIVLGDRIEGPAESFGGFSDIVMLPVAQLPSTTDPAEPRSYFGTTVPRLAAAELDDAVGTLVTYRLVVSMGSDLAHSVVGPLRAFNVETWALLGCDGNRRSPTAAVTACAAFEQAYDHIMVENSSMLHLCCALGIPRRKLRLRQEIEVDGIDTAASERLGTGEEAIRA